MTYSVLFSSRDCAWKIADFGLTSFETFDQLVTSRYTRGKPGYQSPETLNSPPNYSSKTDMWSLGCIVVELATNQKAFASDFAVGRYFNFNSTTQVLLGNADDDAKYIVRDYAEDLLNSDPFKRPSAKRLLERLGGLLRFIICGSNLKGPETQTTPERSLRGIDTSDRFNEDAVEYPDYTTIMNRVLLITSRTDAVLIAKVLDTYFSTGGKHIADFHAIPKRSNSKLISPIISWRENSDTNVKAFFKLQHGDVPCSWLVYYEVGSRWPLKFIQWTVTNLAHLEDLLHAAQHTMGIPRWSKSDIIKLYLEIDPERGDFDEYVVLMNGLTFVECR